METILLTDALLGGAACGAIKFGTALSAGWFWMRRGGCCALYRAGNLQEIDFRFPLVVADISASVVEVPAYFAHESNSGYLYLLCRVNGCGYMEHTVGCAVRLRIDWDGELAEPQPNDAFTVIAEQVEGCRVQMTWFYCPIDQASRPARFRVYWDNSTGQVDYESNIATINYVGPGFYSLQTEPLDAGRYRFAVRAQDANGIENEARLQISIELATESPCAVELLSCSAI